MTAAGPEPAPWLPAPDVDARLALLFEQEQALEAALAAGREPRPFAGAAPRLGVLRQHDPAPVQVPAFYHQPLRAPEPLPAIALVTPTFQAARFLAATLQSVADQRHPRLQYVVQDGGSTDATLQVAACFGSMLAAVESAPDSGMAQAINRGFARTDGEIMAYLNADDLLLPGALQAVAAYFARHPEVDVVYGHRVLVDESGAEIGRWVLPPHDAAVLTWGDYVPQETLFWRRRVWDRVGGALDESFQFALDWDLLLRFRAAGSTVVRLPRFLGAFRVHDAQKTARLRSEQAAAERHRLRLREAGGAVTGEAVRRGLEQYQRRSVVYDGLYRLGVLRY